MTPEELIEAEEGFVPHAYQDNTPERYWTIGIGTLIDKRKGGGITLDEARYLMRNRLQLIYAGLDEKLPWWRSMNEARRAVIVGMVYQMGLVGVLRFWRTLEAMAAGDYTAAAQGMRASLWYRQTPHRASRAADAMQTGTWK